MACSGACDSPHLRWIVCIVPDLEAGCHTFGTGSREAEIHQRIKQGVCLCHLQVGRATSLAAGRRIGNIGDSRSTSIRHALDVPTDCDIFLRMKLTLRETRPIEVLAYELNCVLHGNSLRADYADDIFNEGATTEKRPVGIGT